MTETPPVRRPASTTSRTREVQKLDRHCCGGDLAFVDEAAEYAEDAQLRELGYPIALASLWVPKTQVRAVAG